MKPVFNMSNDGVERHSIPVEVRVTREEYAELLQAARDVDETVKATTARLIAASGWKRLLDRDEESKFIFVYRTMKQRDDLLAACEFALSVMKDNAPVESEFLAIEKLEAAITTAREQP